MESRKILVTGPAIDEQAANLIAENGYDVAYVPPYTNEEALVRIVSEVDPIGVIVRMGRFGASAINAAPSLRVLSKHGVGVDNIDVDAATRRDIPVIVAAGANARSVAEHAIALLLATVKRIVPLDSGLRAGRWDKAGFSGVEIAGLTIGLVGFGAIARHTAVYGQALEMNVRAFDPFAEKSAFTDAGVLRDNAVTDLLAGSDIVSLHCPLTPETRSRRAWPAVLRGTGVGMFLGILPGGGATLSSFCAYSLEKKVSKNPEEFGNGAVEGVAGPEATNNAGAQSSFIPLLTLGIPSNNMMAMMLSAFVIHGITPGPTVLQTQPQIFWGLVASMWIGNLMLVVINLPLIGLWVKLLTVPYRLLYPAILLFCCVGVYSINNRIFDVVLAAGFGLLGYVFLKARCEPGPLLLGFVLGPLLEMNMRRAMVISQGNPSVFFERPISLVLLVATAVMFILMVLPSFRQTRQEAFREEEA